MRRSCISLLIFFLLQISCTFHKNTAYDPDIVKESSGDDVEIEKKIASVRQQMKTGSKDPDLYRKLAVLYRLQGTPRSRSKSIDSIEKAIALEPDNPLNHIEKGLTFYEMQFPGESEASFRRALDIDPGSFDAWYNLGRIKKEEYLENMCFTEELESALECYKKAYNIDNSHEETLFNLGFLHLLGNMYKTSRKYTSLLCGLSPSRPRSWLLAGALYLRLGEFSRSEKSFNQALDLMPGDEKSLYLDTSVLLPPEKREEYLVWPEEARTGWNRKFWLMDDPTMATEVNERLLAHYERVFFARELLTLERLGLDGTETARGHALISYGLPDRLLYNLGGGMDGAIVIWEYNNNSANFRLYFMNEFLNGDYHIPIAPEYRAFAETTQDIFNTIPQTYQYPIESLPVSIIVRNSQRRGSNESTNLEFAVALPDSAINRPKEIFSLSLFSFDSELNRIVNETYRIKPDTLNQIEKSGQRYYVYGISTDLAARIGDCIFEIEISGGRPLRRGSWRDLFEVKNFGSGRLKISSIRLVAQDENGVCVDRLDPIPSYGSGTDLCLAYDIYNLKRGGDNLSRYSVTYSILTPIDSGQGSSGFRNTLYWIKRSITGAEADTPPHITSTLEQSINAFEASDRVRIDIGSLEPGKYLLTLRIEDLVSRETVSEEAAFSISE
ncbi:MAG: GWxTD domain-containing protein [Candidatus Krumholzibacteriota bacterium]|nr:GWxTD domain-containing protein [Candidatus Krumholzibacteriota bacterium]